MKAMVRCVRVEKETSLLVKTVRRMQPICAVKITPAIVFGRVLTEVSFVDFALI